MRIGRSVLGLPGALAGAASAGRALISPARVALRQHKRGRKNALLHR